MGDRPFPLEPAVLGRDLGPLALPAVADGVVPTTRPPSHPLGQSTSGDMAATTVSMSRALNAS
jgi:hypothetical protein